MKEKLTIIFFFIVYLFVAINSIVVMHNIILEAEGWANIILSVIDSLMFSFALFVAGFYLWDEIKNYKK